MIVSLPKFDKLPDVPLKINKSAFELNYHHQLIVSLPIPPSKISFPDPPINVSFPPSPKIISSPSLPSIILLLSSPIN